VTDPPAPATRVQNGVPGALEGPDDTEVHAVPRSAPRFERRDLVAFGVIVAVGVVLRLAWCVYAARPPVGLHDPGFYRLYGEQLASGNGYRLPDGSPTAYYPVGYPLALAAGFLLTPIDWQTGAVAALNILWQALAIVAVYAITRRVVDGGEGRSIAPLVAAGAVALWPNLILHTAVPLSESLFVLLVLVAVLLLVNGPWEARRFETARLVGIGLALGAATLVRPVSVPILVAVLVVWLLAGFGWRRALAHTAVVTGVLVATLVPWVVRNAIVMDAAVVSTNTGDNLCMSRRVGGSGSFEFPNFRCNSGPFDDLPRPAYEVERDEQGRRLAFEFVREHPVEELRLVARRAVATFESDDDAIAAVESYGDDVFLSDDTRDLLKIVSNAWYVVVGVTGAAGLVVLAVRRRPAGLAVVLVALALASAPLAAFGDVRFKVPVLPFLAIGVGVVADALVVRRARAAVRSPVVEPPPPVPTVTAGAPPDPA
jgi:hypothetical protein